MPWLHILLQFHTFCTLVPLSPQLPGWAFPSRPCCHPPGLYSTLAINQGLYHGPWVAPLPYDPSNLMAASSSCPYSARTTLAGLQSRTPQAYTSPRAFALAIPTACYCHFLNTFKPLPQFIHVSTHRLPSHRSLPNYPALKGTSPFPPSSVFFFFFLSLRLY